MIIEQHDDNGTSTLFNGNIQIVDIIATSEDQPTDEVVITGDKDGIEVRLIRAELEHIYQTLNEPQ